MAAAVGRLPARPGRGGEDRPRGQRRPRASTSSRPRTSSPGSPPRAARRPDARRLRRRARRPRRRAGPREARAQGRSTRSSSTTSRAPRSASTRATTRSMIVERDGEHHVPLALQGGGRRRDPRPRGGAPRAAGPSQRRRSGPTRRSYTGSDDRQRRTTPTTPLPARHVELLEDGDFGAGHGAAREGGPAGAREELDPRGARPRLLPQPPLRRGGDASSRPWSSAPGQRLRPLLPRPGAEPDRPARPRTPPPGAGRQPAARRDGLPHLPASAWRAPRSGRMVVRALVQRVSRASVSVDGEAVAAIGPGLLVLLGVARERHRGGGATGSPTRSARCGSSTTPTAA